MTTETKIPRTTIPDHLEGLEVSRSQLRAALAEPDKLAGLVLARNVAQGLRSLLNDFERDLAALHDEELSDRWDRLGKKRLAGIAEELTP